MRIRRNYREPFFRAKRRQGSGIGRLIALFIISVLTGALIFMLWQPDTVRTAAVNMLTEAPTPTPYASDLATQAAQRYLDGDLEGAVELFERAVVQRPDDVNYLYELGQILIDLNRPEETVDIAAHIIDLAPGDPRGFALRARAMVWMGESSAAVPVALAGLEVDPEFAPLYEALSRAQTGSGRWREGLDAGLLATEYGPADVRAHWAYANALAAVAAYDDAINQLERAIEIHPRFVPPFFELAFLYLSSDMDREAIATYDRILSADPRNARALLRQCEAYRKVGEFQRAVGFCEDAVTSDPTYIAAQYRLGLIRYNDRQFELARQAFEACVEQDNANLDCMYRLGLTHYYLQDCDTAWVMLQDSLVMAQAQENAATAIDNIRQGLSAIASDPACPGYAGQAPELTPDPEAEATAEPGDA